MSNIEDYKPPKIKVSKPLTVLLFAFICVGIWACSVFSKLIIINHDRKPRKELSFLYMGYTDGHHIVLINVDTSLLSLVHDTELYAGSRNDTAFMSTDSLTVINYVNEK